MFWLWLIVTILIIAISSYRLGTFDWDADEKVGAFWTVVIGALLWPLALVIVIIIGPFYGFYWLGNKARKKKKESAVNK